jgi:hypothetical protein
VKSGESRQPRGEPERREGSGGGNSKCLARFGDPTCSRVDESERFAGSAIKLLAGASELQRSMDATKEGLPDLLFEGLDFTADRRLSDVQLLCCTGETQMTRRDTESSEQIER